LLIDLFPTILKQLNSLIQQQQQNTKTTDSSDRCFTYSIITLFNCLLVKSKNLTTNDNEAVCFNACSSVHSLASKYLLDTFTGYPSQHSGGDDKSVDFNLLTVTTNLMVDFLDRTSTDLNFTDKKMRVVDNCVEHVFKPVLGGDKLGQLKFENLLMSKLTTRSVYSNDSPAQLAFNKIRSNNLTYLPTISNGESDSSLFNFLASFFKLYLLCFKLKRKQMDDERFTLTRGLLRNPYLKSYLKMFAMASANSKQNSRDSPSLCYYNNQAECSLVYHLLKLQFFILNFEVFFC
jgi:hypothetical protein